MNDSPPLTDGSSDGGLGQHFADLAHRLVTGDEALDADLVVAMTLRAVPTAASCGLVLVRPDRPPLAVAATDELTRTIVRLHQRAHQGPLVDTEPGQGVSLVDDLRRDGRWPEFSAEAADSGVRSLLTLRLPLGGGDQAVLLLCAAEPRAFSDDHVTATSLMAPFAALATEAHLRARDVGNLTAALETSRQIGIAVGIVMASHKVTSEEAFALVRRASMDLNRKVHDVAEEVELTGIVPRHDPAAGGDERALEPEPLPD